jgi:threonine dehydratase
VPEAVTFSDVLDAQARISSGIVRTPCRRSPALSEMLGCEVYCKAEYLQRTGSFKERGARNALLLLSPAERRNGVVAASAGNHALALAYHGRELGIPVTVVMPMFAPLIKQSGCRSLGAELVLCGQNIGEAKVEADRMVLERGLTYVHGFDGLNVIAGAGTLGLEIMEQVPEAEVLLVPVGGAGLIAGLGLAVKQVNPNVTVVGVETAGSASYSAALAAGHPVPTEMQATLADGLAVPQVGANAFEIARRYVDRAVVVDEESVALAILRLVEIEKGVVEGAGASPLAAMMAGACPEAAGKNVVLALCGGNIDPMVLGRVMENGLVADGRLARFRAVISDRPGGLAQFCEVVAEAGASVKQITHERAFASADVTRVEILCTVETRSHVHIQQLLDILRAKAFPCAEVPRQGI